MQSPNPYEPPATESVLEESELPRIFVDGPHLVIASETELPRRCIKTNQLVSERNAVRQTLPWRGRSFRFTLSTKECEIIWYASSWIVRKLLVRRIAEWLFWPAFVFPIFFLTQGGIWPKAMLGFAIIMLLLLVIMKQPLRVVEYKQHRFWITGCCPEFLESLQNSLAEKTQLP